MKTVLFALALIAASTSARAESDAAALPQNELIQDAADYETPGCFSNLGLEDTLYCNRFKTRAECERQTWGLRQYRCHWNE